MHNLESVLVLISPNMRARGEYRCLVVEEGGKIRLPASPVPANSTSLAMAAALLADLTGIKAKVGGVGWLELTQYPLVEETASLETRRHSLGGSEWFDTVTAPRSAVAVPYGAIVPGDVVELKSGSAKWVGLAEAFGAPLAADHNAILQGVTARM